MHAIDIMTFEALQALVALATKPGGSDFYRSRYQLTAPAPLHITSIDEWRQLPMLGKDDFIATPLRNRLFVPLSEVDHLRTSSGTSGKPPLFTPHTRARIIDDRLRFHDFNNTFMVFTVPMRPYWQEEFQKKHGKPARVIVFDPRNPAASVRLAQIAGVDGFSCFIYQVALIGKHMKLEKINERIRYIEVTGELCTRVHYDYMKETFPNATIVHTYGASEVSDDIGIPCRALDGTEPCGVYHAMPEYYLELIDSTTGASIDPAVGAEGDLVISGFPTDRIATPLIRFRIGDTARVVEETCHQHGTWSFTIAGRTEMDFLKVPGGIVRADETIRVIALFNDRITDSFELHRYERATPDGPKIQIELRVQPRGDTDLIQLAENIASKLRVGPSFTYADGVRDQRYLPLVCSTFTPSTELQKTRRLVAH